MQKLTQSSHIQYEDDKTKQIGETKGGMRIKELPLHSLLSGSLYFLDFGFLSFIHFGNPQLLFLQFFFNASMFSLHLLGVNVR